MTLAARVAAADALDELAGQRNQLPFGGRRIHNRRYGGHHIRALARACAKRVRVP
jgi:hypothetical protein